MLLLWLLCCPAASASYAKCVKGREKREELIQLGEKKRGEISKGEREREREGERKRGTQETEEEGMKRKEEKKKM